MIELTSLTYSSAYLDHGVPYFNKQSIVPIFVRNFQASLDFYAWEDSYTIASGAAIFFARLGVILGHLNQSSLDKTDKPFIDNKQLSTLVAARGFTTLSRNEQGIHIEKYTDTAIPKHSVTYLMISIQCEII